MWMGTPCPLNQSIELLVNVRSYVNACYYLILSIIYEICATIFSAKNFKISKDRSGLTRSAVFLIFFHCVA